MAIQVVPPPDVGAAGGLDSALVTAFQGGKAPAIGKPDPYKDRKKMLEFVRKCRDESFDERWIYERVWWRNILYQLNRQWIYYDGNGSQWKDKRLPPWIPRPVTPLIATTTDTYLSVFNKVQLGVTCAPISPNPEDESTAQSLNLLAQPLHYEHRMDQTMAEHDWWLIMTGNAFLHTWWDAQQAKSFVLVPYERCLECGTVSKPAAIAEMGNRCPSCQAESQLLAPAYDEQGQPVQEKLAFGQGCTDALSPFEIAVPSPMGDVSTMPYLFRKRFRMKSWYEEHVPDFAAKVSWEKVSTDRSLQLLRGISTQTEVGPAPSAYVGGETNQSGLTEFELWHKPTKDYPEGLVCRVVESGGLEIVDFPDEKLPGPIPSRNQKGDPLFPWIHSRYERVGGRFWGRSPLDRLIQKQDQVNQIDSLIQLIIQRTANPIWIHPKGAMVRKFTGMPGLVMEYVSSGTQQNKPEKIAGSEVPSSLFRIRDGYLADYENLAGTQDVMKGKNPPGVSAFSALQALIEKSESRFAMVLGERGRAYQGWFELAVELERQYGPEERIWQVLGPNQQWTFEAFQHAQLAGSVRILVEDGSTTPKTNLGKRAAIEQLTNLKVIDPTNPDTAFNIARAFGQTDLLPGMNAAVSAALNEQADFEKWAAAVTLLPGVPSMDPMTGAVMPGMPQLSAPPPGKRLYWDDDVVHIVQHKKWANSDKVRRIIKEKPFLEAIVAWMIQQHEIMQQQAMMNAAMGMPPPGLPGASPQAAPGQAPGQGAGVAQAMSSSNRESGNPADVPRGQNERPAGQGPM